MLKVNVDASLVQGAESFSVGMVSRDHQGSFVAGRTMTLPMVDSVFEAETIGVKEALSWLGDMQVGWDKVQVETDSMLAANAI